MASVKSTYHRISALFQGANKTEYKLKIKNQGRPRERRNELKQNNEIMAF